MRISDWSSDVCSSDLCVGDDPIERLVVVSPYWDSKLEGIARLKAGLGNPVTDILIEDDANGFPVSELPRLSDVALFDISPNAAGRLLHAKLIKIGRAACRERVCQYV